MHDGSSWMEVWLLTMIFAAAVVVIAIDVVVVVVVVVVIVIVVLVFVLVFPVVVAIDLAMMLGMYCYCGIVPSKSLKYIQDDHGGEVYIHGTSKSVIECC